MISTHELLATIPQDVHRAKYTRLACDALRIVCNRIVEIGVGKGDSSGMLACNFPQAELHLVDPWKVDDSYNAATPHFFTEMGTSQECLDAAYLSVEKRFRGNSKIHVWRETSIKAAARLVNKFDLIFTDGNHIYESVKDDIAAWHPHLANPGVMMFHDRLTDGVDKAVSEAFGADAVAGSDGTWCVPITSPK